MSLTQPYFFFLAQTTLSNMFGMRFEMYIDYTNKQFVNIYSVRIIFKVTRYVAIVPGLKKHTT